MLFGFLAASRARSSSSTGVIILPQRQTALVAKQAAEVDMLSDGRLRLGLGVGWNPLEYEALGEDFHTRGKRMDEQIPLMRGSGRSGIRADIAREHFADVGLNPPAHPQHPDLARRQGPGRRAPRGRLGLAG